MAITAAQVRDLRELTGAGMMDCKRALEETGGDQGRAIAFLREKGLAAAAKKAGRVASEGLVAAHVSPDGRFGALVEVNCETDFVAKNDEFLAFVRELAGLVAAADGLSQTMGDGDALRDLKTAKGETVGAALTGLVARIGEHMSVRRFARFGSHEPGIVESYIHMGGKIGVLVELGCAKQEMAADARVRMLARDLAMQVAASKPDCLRREEVAAEVVERERVIYKAQALNEGKPEQVAEKIVLGRLEKFYKEVCLLEQPFIKDLSTTCVQLIKAVSGEAGGEIVVRRFARFERGEGLPRREEDFAGEVRAQLER